MLSLGVSPEGCLLLRGEAEQGWERRLVDAGEVDAVLLLLAGELLTVEVGAEWRWLRELGKVYLGELCRVGRVAEVRLPGDEVLQGLLEAKPLFFGAEWVGLEVMRDWLMALGRRVEAVVAAAGGDLEGWLRMVNEAWHLVGRVTFHLAENKTDTQRPFAFLATFAERLGEDGRVQHLPLGRALQLHAGKQDQVVLQKLLAPVRSAAAESVLLREWLESRRLFQAMAMTAVDAYRVLQETLLFQEHGIVMKLPDWWQQGRGTRPVVNVVIDAPKRVSLNANVLLAFKMERSLDGEPLTDEEWERLLNVETGLVSLRGRWVEVNAVQLRQVMQHWQRVERAAGPDGVGFLEGMKLLAGWQQRVAGEEAEGLVLVPEWSRVVAGKGLAEQLGRLAQPDEVSVPAGLGAQLRPYQRRGLSWLNQLWEMGLGACLADDMGLGKTLQVIALLLRRKELGEEGPCLLVVPASLLANWQVELSRFAPGLNFLVGHGSALEREKLVLLLERPEEVLKGVDVLISTYQMVQRAVAWEGVRWRAVILDEAQAIKNPASRSTQAVKRLQAEHRIAMTGTPVENRPGDLWSLFDFLNAGLLGSAAAFADAVKRCSERAEGFGPLRRLVGPYILRRMKTDRSIISDLPDKIEVKAWCGLSRRQGMIYAKLVDELAKLLRDEKMEPMRRRGLVLGFLMKFKQICNHPSHWNGDGVWGAEDSGKFARLGEIAEQIAERGERVLVFTQFQEVCAPVARFLAGVFGREGLILHGGTPVKKRGGLVEQFQLVGGPPFMVISVKAGGTGLNLTAASHVVHFDRWWNPAVENQATDRAFRIGQKNKVLVHKMVCRGTIEQRIDALIEEKTDLARQLVGDGSGAERFLTEMSADELLSLVALDLNAVG